MQKNCSLTKCLDWRIENSKNYKKVILAITTLPKRQCDADAVFYINICCFIIIHSNAETNIGMCIYIFSREHYHVHVWSKPA